MAHGNNWQDQYLSAPQQEDIASLVKEAEKKTNAEIIPVLEYSACSGMKGPFHLSFLKVVLALIPSIVLSLFTATIAFHYLDLWLSPIYFHFFSILFLYIIFYILFWHFSYPILPKAVYQLYAFAKVKEDFYETKNYQTKNQEAFLIYGFVREHIIILYGDKEIFSTLSEEEIEPILDTYIENAKKRDLFKAFAETIKMSADKLAIEFPKTDCNEDQLSNEMIFKDKK